MSQTRIIAFANKGTGTNEELRLRELLSQTPSELASFDHGSKLRSGLSLLGRVWRERPELLVMEGTGVAGGAVCLFSRLLGCRYVVSSGDSVGPFVASLRPSLGPLFAAYERVLCRFSAGFIGWTPYLVGRALSFGSPRGMSAPGWAAQRPSGEQLVESRERVRAELGIGPGTTVFGIIGSLMWNKRVGYCYGRELLQAIKRVSRPDVAVLIVGGGSGLVRLREEAGELLGKSVFLPGPVPADRVMDYMAALDVGSLPQSVDGVGSFRYTTKISEYLAAGVPVVTGRIPLSYDLDEGWLWRLGGRAPWDRAYVGALAGLMQQMTPQALAERRAAVPAVSAASGLFDRRRQVRSVTHFIDDLLDDGRSGKAASRAEPTPCLLASDWPASPPRPAANWGPAPDQSPFGPTETVKNTGRRIVAFATKGTGSGDEDRLRELLSQTPSELASFDHGSKLRSGLSLLGRVWRERPELLVMEGTGVAGGAVCLFSRLLGCRYVVSSGDSVGPFVASLRPSLGPLFAAYERVLCRFSAGFIGWTPYLVGRALSFGSPRGMSAPGWAAQRPSGEQLVESRERVRAELGIGPGTTVFGIIGSLMWNKRVGYCYGRELLQAIKRVSRPDVAVLIVGGGSGLVRLREEAGELLGKSVFLPGPVPADRVMDYMAALDVGSLPQSVDGVGSFRYTTKISEYLAAGVPVVTGRIPLSYDLDEGWLWRLGGRAPWDRAYVGALAGLMQQMTPQALAERRAAVPAVSAASGLFDRRRQVRSVTHFIDDLLDDDARVRPVSSTSPTEAAKTGLVLG